MNRREFLKGMAALGVITLPLQAQGEYKQFKSIREVREWVRSLHQDYGQMVDKGMVCRHIAHYRWLEAFKQGYLMGILWRDHRAVSHMDNFTQLEDGSFAMIDVVGNVSPAMGWEDWKFDW